jgi:hypothetical protein
MRQAGQAGLRVVALRETALVQERGERGRTDAKTESAEKMPARHHKMIFNSRVHSFL